MTEYRGGSCVVKWVWSGGTLNLSGETRSLTLEPGLDTLEDTSWQSPNRQYLPMSSEWPVSWSGVAQNNAQAPQGTLYMQALQAGNRGTLYVSPYGTAVNALLYFGYALCDGLTTSEPYADVTSITTSWRISGDHGEGASMGYNGVFIVGAGIVGTSYIGP